MTIGEKLREARHALGLTLADVAGSVGCSVQHLSDVELGRRQMSQERFPALCLALGVPAEQLKAWSVGGYVLANSKDTDRSAYELSLLWPALTDEQAKKIVKLVRTLLTERTPHEIDSFTNGETE